MMEKCVQKTEIMQICKDTNQQSCWYWSVPAQLEWGCGCLA